MGKHVAKDDCVGDPVEVILSTCSTRGERVLDIVAAGEVGTETEHVCD